MTTPTPSSLQPHAVYYLKYRPLLLGLGALLLLMTPVVAMRTHQIVLVLLLLFQALMLFVLSHLLRIELSPGGIVYRNLGFSVVSSSWDGVEDIRDLKLLIAGRVRCVVLREPAARGWAGFAWMLPREVRGRVIPISGGWQREGALERQIQQCIDGNCELM